MEQQKQPHEGVQAARTEPTAMQFSLLYFSSNASEPDEIPYQLLLDSARFADQHDFTAIWVPERHFHPFGGLYPNPSVLASALAMVTQRIRLRAGSVVLPLHHPLRVAEEWAVVDNLSQGRVDIAFATGWNPDDFVLAPSAYANRHDILFSNIELVHKLWRGETVRLMNGTSQEIEVRIYPQPRQRQLTSWITCSGGAERFYEAGATGSNVLTALLFQTVDELAEKIAQYRAARAAHGHDAEGGHVTLMLHTFVGDTMQHVRKYVREPFLTYLASSADLWRRGEVKLSTLPAEDRERMLAFAFERYIRTAALIGTPETCGAMIEQLSRIGVDEIACLIDFGVDTARVLESLHALNEVRQRWSLSS